LNVDNSSGFLEGKIWGRRCGGKGKGIDIRVGFLER
jgi:hypothetical protein